jgi:hypothetical protein
VQGTLDTSAVVIAKAADTGNDVIYVLLVNLLGVEDYFPLGEAGFRGATKVKDYLQQLANVFLLR